MKLKIKELLILNWPETQNIWDVVEVEQKKNEEDNLKFDYKKYANFIIWDTEINLNKMDRISDKVEHTLQNIDSKLDWLMNFGLMHLDRWEIDIEDGQDTQYLKEVAWEINKAINDFVKWVENSKNDFDNKFDDFSDKLSGIEEKALSAKNLKSFLNKLDTKERDNTLDNVANYIPWWNSIVNYRKREDEAIKNMDALSRVNF